jgi:hypothetical protein
VTQWDFTLADFPEIAVRYLVWPRGGCYRTALVYAPCCGRRTPADTVMDLRAVPNTHVRAAGKRPLADLDFACDGCVSRLLRDPSNPWTRSALLSAIGAPAAVVADHLIRERTDAAYRALWAQGQTRDSANLLAAITTQVHAEQRAAAEAEAWSC